MITSIVISNYKSFHPTAQVEVRLNQTQRPVFIYGLNGSGKSSIAEVIHRWSQGDKSVSHCTVKCSGQGPFRILVYNHEFVERVIGNVAGMPGIFTLGEPDSETQREIEAKEDQLAALDRQRQEAQTQIEGGSESIQRLKESALAETWKAYAAYVRSDFAPFLSGYANSKQKFFDDLRRVEVGDDEVLDEAERLRERLADVASSDSAKAMVSVDVSGLMRIERDSIWSVPITLSGESRLAGLIQKLGNSDWVSRGRQYLHGRECPFCQEALPPDFEAEIARLFDGHRRARLEHLETQVVAYEREAAAIEAAVSRAMREPFAQQDAALTRAWVTLQASLRANRLAMKAKIENPSSPVEVTVTDVRPLEESLADVNARIQAFNQRIADRDLERKRIHKDFWKLMRRDQALAFDVFEAASAPLIARLNERQEEYRKATAHSTGLAAQLAQLRRKQMGVDAAVAAMNQRLLKLGITSFSIARTDDEGGHYGLRRPGEVAGELRSLSEGEKTLISFLYYLELLRGADQEGKVFPLSKTVVVIDDPISSLSVNYVFDIASVIFHELINPADGEKARQVIVLTHSLFFFHELLRLQGGMKKAEDRCQLLRVVKNVYSNVVEMKAADLMNDYDALWHVLREAKEGQLPSHVVPNTMRCILEYFFSFNNREDWKTVLAKLEHDDPRFASLARFLDRGSHRDGVNLSVMDYAMYDVDYYLAKFRAIFQEVGSIDHYSARMGGQTGST